MDKMLAACLVFGLLWFPGALDAQEAGRPCPPPRLDDGYFLPQRISFSHGELITYTCEKGHKTVLDGWWATSTCLDGKWSNKPQCIDENNCSPPTIPNGNYKEEDNGWYEEGEVIRVSCDPGYQHQNRVATAKCINGTWSSVPVCVRNQQACGHPPQIPHAVIVGEPYRDLFEVDSSVEYECEDGYVFDRQASTKTIFCISGNWTEVPKCIKKSAQAGGHGGSTGTETGDRSGTSSGTSPGTSSGTSSGTSPRTSPGTSPGTSSGTSPGSPSGSAQITNRYVRITNCGRHPVVPNGVVMEMTESYLRYQCGRYFKLEGNDQVYCLASGLWSWVPVCRPNYCFLDTATIDQLEYSGTFYLEVGQSKKLKCRTSGQWYTDHYTTASCSPTTLTLTPCCSQYNPWSC